MSFVLRMFQTIPSEFFSMDIMTIVLVFLWILIINCSHWLGSKSPPKSDAKSVREIPGPRALPIFGTRWIYWPFFGKYKMERIHEAYRDMFNRYGPIIKEEVLFNVPVVSVADRTSVEHLLRTPSRYPLRPATEITVLYRKSRPDRYTSLGLVNEQGERWAKLRSKLTSELTSIKTIRNFVPELSQVNDDFASVIRSARNGETGRVQLFEDFAHRLGLESTCVLILGRRMGFLNDTKDPIADKLAQAVQNHFCSARDTFYGLPFWKVFPSKVYTTYKKAEEDIYEIISEMVDSALKQEMTTCQMESVRAVFLSILQAHDLDLCDKKAAIIDFIAAGIHTLGNSIVFVLYLLAKNREAQKKLYEELLNFVDFSQDTDSLRNANYLHACIQEAYRMLPTAPCVGRILEKEETLNGYELPAGTVVLAHTMIAGTCEENFTDAKSFRPERWLALSPENSDLMHASPLLVSPFGIGRRICPGKRFVDVALQNFIAKMIREFEISYEGELDLKFEFIVSPNPPLNFVFRDRNC